MRHRDSTDGRKRGRGLGGNNGPQRMAKLSTKGMAVAVKVEGDTMQVWHGDSSTGGVS